MWIKACGIGPATHTHARRPRGVTTAAPPGMATCLARSSRHTTWTQMPCQATGRHFAGEGCVPNGEPTARHLKSLRGPAQSVPGLPQADRISWRPHHGHAEVALCSNKAA
ncbi:hypothetical protein VFPFJ_06264 [Purpureocillium lilacinum]|uniref:Uncharacterized protein n=1 Tax=Purpureocillium lilacinum TaxID=33203 RepID=A0A179HBV5_PURLI|nr:hypothetical protein VFPFJ_06264 [Purpureocillium lilacinum]OAQ87806.1 hypothetical protein VFPBJ_01847 [Purpureocillium lilacinum]OAQ89850.1 hypothetical protein VFPFJ_06264 [Purpureocillium lilacinum]